MSVRRLADEAVQPESFAFSAENAEWAELAIAKFPEGRQQSAVIPLLMRAQEQEGWVSRAAIEYVSKKLDMPQIRVLEVATFYTQFQLQPVGTKAHLLMCGTTPCRLRGAEQLMDVCRSKIHPEQHHLNADGTLSWEEVECLGACVNAPMMLVFKDVYEDLTPERLSEIIDEFSEGKQPTPGPQNGRFFAAPEGGFTSLTDEQAIIDNARAWRESRSEMAANSGGSAQKAAAAAPAKAAAPAPKPAVPGQVPASGNAPAYDAVAANKVSPETELSTKQRSGPLSTEAAPAAYTSPEITGGSKDVATNAELDSPDRPRGIIRPQEPDDLTLISGLEPSIITTLHSLGIFSFAQIASWKPEERAWVDAYLNLNNSIERANWIAQAKALADGGEEEYVRVFGKKPR